MCKFSQKFRKIFIVAIPRFWGLILKNCCMVLKQDFYQIQKLGRY